MPQEIKFKLFSKDGAVDISNGAGEQVRFYSDLAESTSINVSASPLDAYIEDVICAINENRQPAIDIYDAFAVVRFCELCRNPLPPTASKAEPDILSRALMQIMV